MCRAYGKHSKVLAIIFVVGENFGQAPAIGHSFGDICFVHKSRHNWHNAHVGLVVTGESALPGWGKSLFVLYKIPGTGSGMARVASIGSETPVAKEIPKCLLMPKTLLTHLFNENDQVSAKSTLLAPYVTVHMFMLYKESWLPVEWNA